MEIAKRENIYHESVKQPSLTTPSQNRCLFRLPLWVFDTVSKVRLCPCLPGQSYKALQEKNKIVQKKTKCGGTECLASVCLHFGISQMVRLQDLLIPLKSFLPVMWLDSPWQDSRVPPLVNWHISLSCTG